MHSKNYGWVSVSVSFREMKSIQLYYYYRSVGNHFGADCMCLMAVRFSQDQLWGLPRLKSAFSKHALHSNMPSNLVPSTSLEHFRGERGFPWYGPCAQPGKHFATRTLRTNVPSGLVPGTFLWTYFGAFLGIGEGPGWHLVRYLCETPKALHQRHVWKTLIKTHCWSRICLFTVFCPDYNHPTQGHTKRIQYTIAKHLKRAWDPRSGMVPNRGFRVAMLLVGALCFYQVHFGCTVLPKWPLWAYLFYSAFYSVSELRRAYFHQACVAQAVLPADA